ncbi:MAG TPA: DUF2884 family protein [Rhodanobacter sp.]|nr:DUF2884 family protein [Rhodanobacter sp.]
MRGVVSVLLVATLLAAAPLSAQDLASTCHASSSYDVTLNSNDLVFDRPSPAPLRVELRQGALRVDGVAVPQGAENQDRLTLFERELRALAPRVRTVAQNGVDIAVQGMLAETSSLGLSPATRTEFAQRLARHAGDLKQRIAATRSTHDFQGDFASRYENELVADLAPLVAGDLGQQAVDAAMSGDLQAAADLRERATTLATQLQPRMQQRMQTLRPQIAALCPAIRRLAELQQGVRDAHGRPLHLLQMEP